MRAPNLNSWSWRGFCSQYGEIFNKIACTVESIERKHHARAARERRPREFVAKGSVHSERHTFPSEMREQRDRGNCSHAVSDKDTPVSAVFLDAHYLYIST